MSTLGLLTALFLPLMLGTAWLQLLWQNSHWAAKIGYGYLLGIFAVTSILRIWDGLGLALSFLPISILIIGLSIIPLAMNSPSNLYLRDRTTFVPYDAAWQRLICLLLIAILTIRYGGILLEIIWRPLYPWDAWMNWAPKAKTWFELRELTPFVNRMDWISDSAHLSTYTLGNPQASTYPPLVPLIQTWTALGLGIWIDNLTNLPWVLCSIALGFSFYGQGRMLGAKPHTTLLVVFLVLSMPFGNTHTALAGYAELWLATYYALAGMAFINWSQTRSLAQATLCIVFTIACIQTKNPGIIWAATFIPASIFVLLPKRWGYLTITLAIISILTLLYFGGFSLHIANIGKLILTPENISLPGLGTFPITYHPVSGAFVANELIRDNWHLIGWLVLFTVPPMILVSINCYQKFPASILVLSGLLFLYIVFFYTKHYLAAVDNTTVNRAVFHLTPLLCFYMLFSATNINPSIVIREHIATKTVLTKS